MSSRLLTPTDVRTTTFGEPLRRAHGRSGDSGSLLAALQRAAGNQAVARALRAGSLPPGLVPPTVSVQRDGPSPLDTVTEKTGVEVEPGPVRPGVLGSPIPLPASLRLLKPPGGGRGGWLTAPAFSLKLDPRGLVAGLLDAVHLGRFQLINPTLVYSADSGSFTAVGTVSIPTNYPGLDTPTNVEVRIRSTGLKASEVTARTGPFVAELTIDLDYDSAPLKHALEAASRGDLGAAASALGGIDRTAGFRLSGTAGPGWPGHKIPLAYVRGSGSIGPSGAGVQGGAAGAIGLPKGTFHPEIAVPAAGAAVGAAKAEAGGGVTGGYGFAGITGTPSIQNLVTGNLRGAFAPFAYAQATGVRRTSNGHEFSIKLSAQWELGSREAPGTPTEQVRGAVDEGRKRERYFDKSEGPNLDPSVLSHWKEFGPSATGGSGASIVVTGTFDLLGGR
jgi:hypothetical protein